MRSLVSVEKDTIGGEDDRISKGGSRSSMNSYGRCRGRSQVKIAGISVLSFGWWIVGITAQLVSRLIFKSRLGCI